MAILLEASFKASITDAQNDVTWYVAITYLLSLDYLPLPQLCGLSGYV